MFSFTHFRYCDVCQYVTIHKVIYQDKDLDDFKNLVDKYLDDEDE